MTPLDCDAAWRYEDGASWRLICAETHMGATALYRLLRRLGIPRRQYHAPRWGIPVYDEDGALFAKSRADAARRLGVTWNALERHVVDYADGVQLFRRPRHGGQHGGAYPALDERDEGG